MVVRALLSVICRLKSVIKDKAVNEITQESKASTWLTDARHTIHIAILSAITLIIGVYLVSTLVLIAKDGIVYIDVAQKMTGGIFKAVCDTRQPPGYPFLIYEMHQIAGLFYGTESLAGWIISAQGVSLLSKLIASIALYFVGSYFAGSRISFWGVLILSVLPDALDFGADALSDWPSLMFLSIGFLLLLLGTEYRKVWLWGLAGIAAGLGYLIRPECAQVAFYGGVWLAYNLIRPQGEMKRGRAAGSLVLLAAGFAVIALPYMQCKGYVIPEQQMWELPALLNMHGENLCLAGLSVGTLIKNAVVVNKICETMIYYFVPFLAIGCYYYFRKHPKTPAQTFFIAAFILVNVARAVWQPSYFGFLSRRHTLPLAAFTIFFIPIGLQIITGWLSRKKVWDKLSGQEGARCWFLILMFVGVSICAVKIIRMSPLGWKKQGYRQTAKWLNENTVTADIIAVPDKRIAFYAERQGLEYNPNSLSGTATVNTSILHTDGSTGGAFKFTGSQRVSIPDNDMLNFGTGDFSISLIVKVAGYINQGSEWNSVLSKGALSHTVSPFFGLYVGNSNHLFFIAGNIKEYAISDQTMKDGRYHHIAATRKFGKLLLYVDGVLQAKTGAFSGSVTTSSPVVFGADEGSIRYFTGNLDEVRVYGRLLTDLEIRNLAGGVADVYLGLVGHWRLDDNAAAKSILNSSIDHFGQVSYIVKAVKCENDEVEFNKQAINVYSTQMNRNKKSEKIVVYRTEN